MILVIKAVFGRIKFSGVLAYAMFFFGIASATQLATVQPVYADTNSEATQFCAKHTDFDPQYACMQAFKKAQDGSSQAYCDGVKSGAAGNKPGDSATNKACQEGASAGAQYAAQNPGQGGSSSSQGGAGQCGNARFLTFPTWWRGITLDSECSLELTGMPPEKLFSIIAANVAEIIIQLVGYASVIFIIIGGFKYMISTGSSDGMAGARKTIQNAVIGLLVSILSVGIVNIVFSRL